MLDPTTTHARMPRNQPSRPAVSTPDPRTLLCSVDGDVMPVGEATISIMDEGLIRGDGAFEMLKLYDNRPFALADHLDRLDHSAEGIFLEYDRAAFEQEIGELLEANRQHDGELRLVLTRGGRRIAIIEPPHAFEHGLALSGVEYQPTIVLTGLKTLSYEANMTATRIAKRDGADEALLVDPDGIVMEAPTSTIFWVDAEGGLHTPALGAGILASITRDRIMRMAPVEESHEYKLQDVLEATEVFLASSLREVQGVASLDGLTYTCPGPVTERVAGLLSARIQAELSGALNLEGG
jgi:branched-chain amino acid aminotransferase